jgi:hypothetical protein
MLVVHRLAGVLLEMQPLDADLDVLELALPVGPTEMMISPSPTIGCLNCEIW